MKTNIIGGMVVAFSIVLSGCGAQGHESAGPTTADTPDEVTSSPGAEAPAEPADEGSSEAAEASPAPADSSAAVELPTDVPASVMLGDEDLDLDVWPGVVRAETEGLVPWIYTDSIYGFDETCVDTAAVPAEAMRTVKVTDPEMHVFTGLQQVAAFADAAQAEKAFEDVTSRLEECTTTAGDSPLYRSETFPVGDGEGFGFIIDYSPSFPEGSGVGTGIGDDAVGDYLGFVRRGNAITLVWSTGGERIVGEERDRVAERVAKAWPLLCRYDPAGC